MCSIHEFEYKSQPDYLLHMELIRITFIIHSKIIKATFGVSIWIHSLL